jgi:photosystem I subunit 11
MNIAKNSSFSSMALFSTTEKATTSGSNVIISPSVSNRAFDVVSAYEGDPFVGNLSTPITTSSITKSYLSLLPAYKSGLSPLLRGINIGFVHGYLLLGPFVKLGPLRTSEVANFVGFVSTLSLIVILTTCLLIYGFVTFSNAKENERKSSMVDFLNSKGWRQFTSGFIIGGFGGTSVAYIVLKLFGSAIG